MNRNLRECDDCNPKIVQREIRFQKDFVDVVKLCNSCKNDSLYSEYLSEVVLAK